MRKEEKNAIIVKLKDYLNEYQHFYITDISGLNAEQTSDLRRECFKNDIKLLVTKNTLLHKALQEKGVAAESLFSILKGNTALMLCNTGNAPAKVIKKFKDVDKKNPDIKPVLKGAYVEENVYLGANQLSVLVAIKSKKELLGDLIALLQSPAKNVVSAVQSSGSKIHGILTTLEKRG